MRNHDQIRPIIRSTSNPTCAQRRSIGGRIGACLLVACALHTGCDSPESISDDDNEFVDAGSIPAIAAHFAEMDPEEQDDDLEDEFIALYPNDAFDLSGEAAPATPATKYPAKCYGTQPEYEITVKTGPDLYSGTGAKVSFRFRGNHNGVQAWTTWIVQSGAGSLFERGNTDHFSRFFKSPGAIDYMELKHDNSGVSAGWYVEWVSLHDTCSDLTWRATVNRWLDKGKGLSLFVSRPMSKI